MSALSIQPTFPIFTETDGQPLENGYIWIGTANLDPQVNPINVYWDAALTIQAPQPIRTLNGYPSRNGTPARLYVNVSNYSIRVQDKNGSLVYSAAEAAPSISAGIVAFVGFKGQVGTVEDLAGDDGSDWIGFEQLGGSAVPRSAQDKLREIASRADFVDDAAFIAGKGDKPNIDGDDNFNAKVTPEGEGPQIDLSAAVLTVAAGPRDAVVYAGAQSVKVFRNYATMGGFRFRGQYTKGRAPTFAMPSNKTASLTTDLGAMSATTFENWYAIFACANDGDATATLKLMPYLRAGVVSGSNIPLSRSGEGIYVTSTQTYAWTAINNLAGTDLLVISENGGFSGRVTTITANSTSQITATSIGSITEGDYLLPAPPGFDHYVYLGSFYEDTAEVRNIYDTGDLVKATMIYLVYPNVPSGPISGPPGETFNCAGYICPLATGVVIDSTCVLSTASAGDYFEYFDGDGGNHIVQTFGTQKNTAGGNMSVVFPNAQVPFLYFQTFNFYNAGSLTATRINGQLNVTGWFEP